MEVGKVTTEIIKQTLLNVPHVQDILQTYIEGNGLKGNFDIELKIELKKVD